MGVTINSRLMPLIVIVAVSTMVIASCIVHHDTLQEYTLFHGRSLFHFERDSLEFDSTNREPNEFENLKFLFFGTSRTYGQLLHDRLNEAYPFLLSPHATNLAIPGSTPTFPCMCAESMIKEAATAAASSASGGAAESTEQQQHVDTKDNNNNDIAFDVIVVEFDRPFFDETAWLVHRLRERYPDAHIIVMEFWLLSYTYHKPTGRYLPKWAQEEGFSTHGNGVMTDKRLTHYLKTTTELSEWSLQTDKFQYSPEEVQVFRNYNAVVLPIPISTNARHAAQGNGPLFFNDMHHYSVAGHEHIRNAILQELRDANFRTEPKPMSVVPWTSPDSCTSWFRTGQVPLPHSNDFVVREFKQDKYALELHKSDGTSTTSWIEVDNTLGEDADLYVERMVTSPDCMYPKMVIQVTGTDDQPVVAGCEPLPWAWTVNVAKGLYVGTIPPGKWRLEFEKNVHDTHDAPWPFRVLGITVTAKGNSITKGWSTPERYS